MTVGQLKTQLQGLSDDSEIWMASDPEGNSIAGVDEVSVEDTENPDRSKWCAVIWPNNTYYEES